jgi:hypothetical protein
VTVLAIAWILATPYAFAAAVSSSERVRAVLVRHYVPMITAGWTGVALFLLGAFALHGPARAAALLAGAPLAGLSFWTRGGGGDDGDGDGDGGVDWDRFMRDFDRWAKGPQPVHR